MLPWTSCDEVAIDAVHPLLEVDVQQVDGHAVAVGGGTGAVFGAVSGTRYCSLIALGMAIAAMSCSVDVGPSMRPSWSSRLPLRSFLKTARKTQPWPWKSANWVCLRLRVQVGDVLEEPRVGPEAAARRPRRGWTSAPG